MIKYILFDLDDTLLDFVKSEKEAIFKTFEKIGKICSENIYQDFKKINEECFNRFQSNELTRNEFHKARFTILLNKYNIEEDPLYVNSLYVSYLSESAIPYDDTLDILKYLKNKNYKLYIVSNGQKEVQFRRLLKANILSYFDYVFISSEIGYNKPDIRVLDYVLSSIYKEAKDVNKDEFILIGDRENADIKCALDFGIKSVLLGTKETKASYKCKNLSELKNIL